MAGSSIIGALRVSIGADSAALDKGLDESRAKLGQFAGELAKTGAVIAAALTAAYATAALGVNNAINSMDQLNKQSQKIGIPVEQLSALKLAADISGVSMEQLGVGVGKLSRAMTGALADPTSDAAKQFRALGVSVQDATTGKLLPTQTVLEGVATKFSNMDDGARKTSVAMALFGKSGADLIPFLNQGGSGIAAMTANAQKFGIVIDGPTAAAAEKFRDTLTLLGAAKDGLIVKLTAFLLPALQQFADRMLAGASNSDKQKQKLSVLTTAFEGLARGVLFVADNFKIVLQLGAVFVGAQITAAAINMGIAFVGLARAIQATGLVMAAFEAVRSLSLKGLLIIAGVVAIATGNFETLKDKLGEIASYVAAKVPDGAGVLGQALKGLGLDTTALTADLRNLQQQGLAPAKKGQDDYNDSVMRGKQAFDRYIDSQTKSLAGQQAELDTSGMAAGAKERLKVVMQGLAVAQANNITLTDEERVKLTQTANAAELLALQFGNVALIGQNNPFAPIILAIDATNQKLASGSLSVDDYAKLSQQSAQLTAKMWSDSATSLGGSFESIGSSFASMNDAWGKAAKVGQTISAGIAFVNSYTAASTALATAPWPANLAIAASVLASGLKFVASIKSIGFADGGFVSGPGSSISDSIPAMLSNGEFVMNAQATARFRPQLEAMNSGGSGGGVTVINLAGLGRDNYSRDEVVRIIEGINSAVGDGYDLRISRT